MTSTLHSRENKISLSIKTWRLLSKGWTLLKEMQQATMPFTIESVGPFYQKQLILNAVESTWGAHMKVKYSQRGLNPEHLEWGGQTPSPLD